MRLLRRLSLTCLVAIAALLGTDARAAFEPFTYTVTVASNSTSVSYFGNGHGPATVGANTLDGSGSAPPAPSGAPASNAIGGYTYAYAGGPFGFGPGDGFALVTGTIVYDVTLTDSLNHHSAVFVVDATFNSVVAANLGPATPALSTPTPQTQVGNVFYDINAFAIGTNSHVPGTAIFTGFEYSTIPVPEPQSMALLGIGGASIFGLVMRRKRQV
jgi:hypothetical protein